MIHFELLNVRLFVEGVNGREDGEAVRIAIFHRQILTDYFPDFLSSRQVFFRDTFLNNSMYKLIMKIYRLTSLLVSITTAIS